MPYIVNLDNGKYTLKNDNGLVSCLRHGEEWQPSIHNNLMLSLIHSHEDQAEEIERLKQELKEAKFPKTKEMYPSARLPKGPDPRVLDS